MSEFDFDELDRAVNHALTGDRPVRSTNDVNPAGPTDSITVARTSMMNSAAVPSAPSSVPERPVTNPAARRASSGRFMDMIHPSSDMRSSDSNQRVAAPVSAPAPAATPAPKPATPSPAPTPSLRSWASDHHVATGPSNIPASKPSSPSTDEDLGFDEEDEEPRALESPFLPDAKVQKRPLGGSPNGDEMQFEEIPSLSKSIDEALSEVALVEAEEAKAPAETPDWTANTAFKTDPNEKLLEAPKEELLLEEPEPEESESTPEPQQGFSHAMQYPQENTLGDIPQSPSEEVNDDAMPISPAPEQPERPTEAQSTERSFSAPVISSSVPAGPASITQQYKEQPSSSAQPGAIFDTESYHQPITPKVKKRSGAWVVLWIVLLIIAGAAAGAGFYLYVLPML